MDPDRRRPRVWLLPIVFALVALSWPVQMYVDERWGEPYPGLFQPAFSGVPGHDHAVTYRAIAFTADGQSIDDEVLLPGMNSGRRSRLLMAMFPLDGSAPEVDPSTRARMRSRIARALDVRSPLRLTATWERRRFDLDTRRTSVRKVLAVHDLDLTERAP